ncbi:MAG: sugar phosphate isomerase/epimerase [Bacteroidetes bacterium]|nr:sugar phosphate isomerase/epimerase [Bacteroidota bacterium]MCZ6899613.1 sugar phosphate isomerase/epimerase [Bacteroidota bacterium]
MDPKRRNFIKHLGGGIAGYSLLGLSPALVNACSSPTSTQDQKDVKQSVETQKELFFKISLAEWSLHNTINAGQLDNLDFPAKAKELGINAVEYVNQFFKDKAKDQEYLKQLLQRTQDVGVENVLIMIDGEGDLAELDDAKRAEAIENHYQWVEAAKYLGCHSIRVNARGIGSPEDVKTAGIDGLGRLSEFGAQQDIGIIVENHGGQSSNGKWLSEVISQVNNPICGTLPDFGNFCIKQSEPQADGSRTCVEEYDRYQGVKELMPFAKGVSAKSNDFDESGNEIHTDFVRMLTIVKEAGYRGYIGIEYEGNQNEEEGILATKKLLERVGAQVS